MTAERIVAAALVAIVLVLAWALLPYAQHALSLPVPR